MEPELADRIYESSLVPELWPGVLDELGRLVESPGGTLFITKAKVQHWTASPRNRDRAQRVVGEGWYWRGQFSSRALAIRHAGFLTDLDLFTLDELDQEPIFATFGVRKALDG
jgi:hypothetical protein